LGDPPLTTRAPAKINLSLHVLGRRADGYHELGSFVAFAGIGDTLTLAPGQDLSLSIEGPTAARAGPPDTNLVLKAARNLLQRHARLRLGAFHLVKRLPVAAGIGGGSSDAAAALRLLARLNGLSLDHPAVFDAACATGADVPVCLHARARVMRGIGERLGPPLRLPPLFAVLVNPGVALSTAEVFGALDSAAEDAPNADVHLPTDVMASNLFEHLAKIRNDLEPAARKLAPVIGDALALLGGTPGCRFTRMSGSGATVFGLFDDCAASAAAAKLIRRARPGWWIKATVLR
jgi:4-diphosphocytidyl-2-C-methyl-D-erythritol kinase